MRRRSALTALLSLLFGLLLSLSSYAAHAQTIVYVPKAPPPPIVEVRPVAPGSGYFWVGGYHTWNGRAYVWVPGRWTRIPPGRRAWVPGHWAQTPRGWQWIPGHWR